MAREVDVGGRPAQDVHDVVHWGGHAGPPFRPGARVVPPRDSVRDVSLRRHPVEVRGPLAVGRKAPEGGQDAIDRGVLPVPLHKGELPGDVVY